MLRMPARPGICTATCEWAEEPIFPGPRCSWIWPLPTPLPASDLQWSSGQAFCSVGATYKSELDNDDISKWENGPIFAAIWISAEGRHGQRRPRQ
jgi:hypothetical protein